MSGKGNCYDNAMVETLFKTIKSELIWRTKFQSRCQAEHAIARYIDGFYNPVCWHLVLGYKSQGPQTRRRGGRSQACNCHASHVTRRHGI